MKKIYFLLQVLLLVSICSAQVGINTTSPKARLDIASSNQALPSNKDGLLIPKIDAFPLINPTIDQQGMMVYLTTFVTLKPPGFYFWDHFTTSWKPLGGNYSGWGLNGNSGINAATDFIGTIDNVDVVFKRFGTTSGVLGASNTSFGYFSLPANTTGTSNTAVGGFTLRNNTAGSRNTAIGNGALKDNTIGNDNTATGIGALRSNTSGNNNTASGQTALAGNTTGADNTATGYFTLFSNTIGINNTANGSYALNNNTTGDSNTAIGLASLSSNTTGNQNTATGLNALSLNTIGIENTANGSLALLLNSTGNYNSAFGRLSLLSNTTGSENSSIGYSSNVASANLSNATAIGARTIVGASNSLVLGSINGVNGATSGVNVGIGTTTPLDKLHVIGNIRMVDGNQAAGKVLISDANGTGSWQSNSATNAWGLAGNALTNSAANFIGTTDSQSLAFRTNNVERMSILNTGNVGIGTSSPSRNLHIAANSTSTTNGQLYLQQSGTGDALMHFGLNNNRHFNIGLDATDSFFKIATAALPTAVSTGTILTITPTGFLGIGTATPQTQLEVAGENYPFSSISEGNIHVLSTTNFSANRGGSITLGGMTSATADSSFGSIEGRKANSTDGNRAGYLTFKTNSGTFFADRMRITADGDVGIGTTTPGGLLELSLNEGRKPISTLWTIPSDARLKTVDGIYEKGLSQIIQLKPIKYHYKNTSKKVFDDEVLQQQAYGFLAQDVQTVFPECVGADEDGYLNFDMHAILVASINAFKELDQKNKNLKDENDILKKKLEIQSQIISEILNRLQKIEARN